MEQRALVIGWPAALALLAWVGALSGGLATLGVFLLARFTRVFDAYAGERAKLLAQFHNLDRLVEQTTTLTATAETIKARISDEVWERQWRLNQKRDIHARLVKTLSQLESEKLHMLAIRSEELVARPPEEIKEVEVAIGQLIGEVRELEALAMIFCTKETISALHTYFDASHYGAARGRERLRKEIERLGQARSGAILAAQKDLGIEPGT
jgi:hypothetical protein